MNYRIPWQVIKSIATNARTRGNQQRRRGVGGVQGVGMICGCDNGDKYLKKINPLQMQQRKKDILAHKGLHYRYRTIVLQATTPCCLRLVSAALNFTHDVHNSTLLYSEPYVRELAKAQFESSKTSSVQPDVLYEVNALACSKPPTAVVQLNGT